MPVFIYFQMQVVGSFLECLLQLSNLEVISLPFLFDIEWFTLLNSLQISLVLMNESCKLTDFLPVRIDLWLYRQQNTLHVYFVKFD